MLGDSEGNVSHNQSPQVLIQLELDFYVGCHLRGVYHMLSPEHPQEWMRSRGSTPARSHHSLRVRDLTPIFQDRLAFKKHRVIRPAVIDLFFARHAPEF